MTSPAKTQDVLFAKKVAALEVSPRLDLWLRAENPAWSRKKIKQWIDNHQVSVNGQGVYVASWTLKKGDAICVFAHKRPKDIFLKVLYEDPFLLAVDKPPYLVFEELVGSINAYLKRKHGAGFHPYVGMLHRLDKDTSGVFIVTKDAQANGLVTQFKTHLLRKTYWAIVHGRTPFFEKRFTAQLAKGRFKGGKKVEIRSATSGEGKWSETDMRVLERYRDATLLELAPKTGRTHQIRAHLDTLGFPLIGDRIYGRESNHNPICEAIPFPRQALHAHSLAFTHPISGKKMKITAPIPKDMQGLVDRLRSQ